MKQQQPTQREVQWQHKSAQCYVWNRASFMLYKKRTYMPKK